MSGRGDEMQANVIESHINESIHVVLQLNQRIESIVTIAGVWTAALRSGGKVLFCGNGGSAADCQHLAGELVGRFQKERRALPSMTLTDTAILTAVGNDYGYEHVFERQVSAHGREGDVLVAVSTSGESANVIRAVRKAKELGMTTVAFTGSRGRLRGMTDHALCVPSVSTPRIQEAYMVAGHIICGLVEEALFVDMAAGVGNS